MTKCNEAIARHRNQLSNGKQALGVLGSFLLLFPRALYKLVVITAMAASLPFAALLCLSHQILRRPEE